MVTHIFMVHGYSVRSLSAYGHFPTFFSSRYASTNIFLSAFNSLDDVVTCDDLARALEDHIAGLEKSSRIDIASTAFICHSTGAIVTRRWILNRLKAGQAVPSHFISVAGANHGSTLAQLGETMAAHVFRELAQGTSVGRGVLTDLDYGSDFLLRLNQEWLDAVNGPLSALYAFSMGGDSVGDWYKDIIWQTKEPGSDSTVRISGANLNYSILEADADEGSITYKLPKARVPHLILRGYSHSGPSNGIIDCVQYDTEAPFAAVNDALSVSSPDQYAAIGNTWLAQTAAWTNDNQPKGNVCATLVFHLIDRANRPIDDSFIVLKDSAGEAAAVSSSLIGRPIQNDAVHASVSFYVNQPAFQTAAPHVVTIHANSGSGEVDYADVTYTVSRDVGSLVSPNETTYVFVKINRHTDQVYQVYNFAPKLAMAPPWPPFPEGEIPLAPPPIATLTS
jgi:hypothetical protein